MVINAKTETTPNKLIIYFIILVLLISIGGYLNFLNQENGIKQERHNDILVISELKASQIERWREERLNDAEGLMFEYLDNLHPGKESPEGNRRLLSSERSLLRAGSEYKNIYIVESNLKARGIADSVNNPIGSSALNLAKAAMAQKKMVFGDLSRNDVSGAIDLDVCAPLVFPGAKAAYGAIVLRIDPYKYLFPLLSSNPMHRKSFETSLVRKEGDRVLYLNELKYSREAPLKLSIPVDNPKQISVMAAKNIEGQVQGLDYRGAPVIAVIKPIAGSQWVLETKIDKDEIYSEVRTRALLVFCAVMLFTFTFAAVMGFLWHRQSAGFYKQLYSATVERKAITSHYKYLLQYANDIILLFNKDLKIVEANEKAVQTYGYSLSELQEKNLKDLRGEEGLATLQKEQEELEKRGSLVFTTVHKRKDGTTFPVEVSTRVIVVEWQQFYQSIIRDISGRKT